MDLQEAIQHLIESKEFKEIVKNKENGNNYRQFKYRFESGVLGDAAMVTMLLKHGYSIKVIKPN